MSLENVLSKFVQCEFFRINILSKDVLFLRSVPHPPPLGPVGPGPQGGPTVTVTWAGPGLGCAPLSVKSWSRPKAGKHTQGALGAVPEFQGCGPVTRVQRGDARRRQPGAASPAVARPVSGTDRLNFIP